MGREGVWAADCVVDHPKQIDGSATLALGDGKLVLHGTILPTRTGLYGESAVLRLLGGAGGMATQVDPQFYRTTTARIIAQALLAAAGEKLSPTAEAKALNTQLPAYAHVRQSAAAALSLLCERIGAIWRVLPDGTVWVGTETWPKADDPGDLLREDPQLQRSVYGTEVPSLLPGTAIDGRYISIVEHHVSPGEVTTVVTWETSPETEDRVTRTERAIFNHFAARFDWHASYGAKVISQNGDGTLELKPDNSDIPGLTKVPVRYGIPGIEAKILPGARVMVSFDGGDPGAPVAMVWESGTITELTINVVPGTGKLNLGGAGGLQVVLDGDQAGPYPVTALKSKLLPGKIGP
jgi:hypothetical protein